MSPRAWWAWSSVSVCLQSVKPPASVTITPHECAPSGLFLHWGGKLTVKFAKVSGSPFPCFTRAFPHPRDRCHAENADTIPPHCYRTHALLWNDSATSTQQWHIPTSVESQHSAIGNSFHIPSLALVLCILFSALQFVHAAKPSPALAGLRCGSRRGLQRTARSCSQVFCQTSPASCVRVIWPKVFTKLARLKVWARGSK